jgi:hypothetical protein
MKVTKPMIERGLRAYQGHPTMEPREVVEDVLRAALNDPAEPPKPIAGQMTVDDYPEVYREATDEELREADRREGLYTGQGG